MYRRHDEIPPLSAWPDRMAARHFNLVFRALKRLTPDANSNTPGIRLPLVGLKTLDLILQADAWIVTDRAFNDIPVVAWADFRPDADRPLHEDVPCELRYYHAHAGMITRQVMELMDQLLEDKLSGGDKTHEVLAYPGVNCQKDK